jgi:hypothetical protein
MSKKLYYGGKEVVANDPRLPEILAEIVTLIDCALARKVTTQRYGSTSQTIDIDPPRYIEFSEELLAQFQEIGVEVSIDAFPVFKYNGEFHLNIDNVTAAECIKRPGLKVVDED